MSSASRCLLIKYIFIAIFFSWIAGQGISQCSITGSSISASCNDSGTCPSGFTTYDASSLIAPWTANDVTFVPFFAGGITGISAQLNSAGSYIQYPNKSCGIGNIIFDYKAASSSAFEIVFTVEYNLGNGWVIVDEVVATTTVQNYNMTVNIAGDNINFRIKVKKGINAVVDDINLTDYQLSAPAPMESSTCDLCPGDLLTFSAQVEGLSAGANSIEWFQNTTATNITTSGISLGMATISTTVDFITPEFNPCSECPEIVGIMVDACNGTGSEEDNEFLMLSSGSGFNTTNLQINLDADNNNIGSENNDINFGANPCGLLSTPTINPTTDLNLGACNNVVLAGSNVEIPANAIVFVFMSAGFSGGYDFSSLCMAPMGDPDRPIYILQNACTRTIGAFSNGTASGIKMYDVIINSCSGGCNETLSYDSDNAGMSGDGDFVYQDGGTVQYSNNGCTAPNVELPELIEVTESVINDLDIAVSCTSDIVYVQGTISDPCGALLTDVFQYNVICPEVTLTGSATICSGQSTDLTLTFSGAGTFDFALSDGTMLSGLTSGDSPHTVSVSPTMTTVYTISSFTDNGSYCTTSIMGSATVTVMPVVMEPATACYETATFNNTTCVWDVTGTQPAEPSPIECWQSNNFDNTSCTWMTTGTQPAEPSPIECWQSNNFDNTSCTWMTTGTQPAEPSPIECWQSNNFDNTSCTWMTTGTQPAEPSPIECWQSNNFDNTSCTWMTTGTQPAEPSPIECWQSNNFDNTSCTWMTTGTQPAEPSPIECWQSNNFDNTSCTWMTTGTQPAEPSPIECWQSNNFDNTSCTWMTTGTQPAEPSPIECWQSNNFDNTSCTWMTTGTQPTEPSPIECWQSNNFDNTSCTWMTTGTQPAEPSPIECWQSNNFDNTSCTWMTTGTQPAEPSPIECWQSNNFDNTSCTWMTTGTQPAEPSPIECWQSNNFDNTSCTWMTTGTQPAEPSPIECWQSNNFDNTSCTWMTTGTQPTEPSTQCYESATFNNTTCIWDVTGTQPTQPSIVNCWDAFTFNNTTCAWDNTGAQDPQPPIVNCWDVFAFNNTTCAWDNTGTQDPQPPIVNCWDVFSFNNTTCAWENTGTQDPQPPIVNCWDVFSFNNTTCAWENTGTQDPQPPIINCWDVFAFNNTTCAWDNTGSQDPQPPVVNCWDAFSFNNTTCAWENTGTQDPQPPVVNCWDAFSFNNATCAWENTGSQDPQPPIVNCWDVFAFNNTTCAWDNTGIQDPQPPIVNCWDVFAFNNTTCAWENTGTQDPQPPIVNCWDAFTFNNTTCAWDNTGTQDPQPPIVNCWDVFAFNNTTCAWDNTGSQDPQPPIVNCWDAFSFNNTTCAWDNTGTQDPQPPIVNCWDVFSFNNTTCAWDNTGSQDPQPPVVNCWDVFSFNNTTCAWENTGSQDPQPPIVNCWDVFSFNNTTCAWENTGTQDPQPPIINCWDVFAFNNTTCAWDNTGAQDPQPPIVNCWDVFAFNNTTCAWDNTGTQDPQPPIVNCWDAFTFNNTTCAWENTGTQDPQPPIVNCWDVFSFNNTTCAWDNTGSQDPQPPVVNCWDVFSFNNTTCAWENTGTQDPQPPIVNCWDVFSFNNTTCAWENTGTQDPQPPIINCWDVFAFNNTTCAWDNTGSQDPQPPVVNCWDVFAFNNTTCAWENTGTQDPQPPIVNCWDAFTFNNTTCAWDNTGTQDPQPPIVNCWDVFAFNNTTCAWDNTGTQDPQPPIVNCWDAFTFNNTTCAWENTGTQDPQPPIVNCWDVFSFNNTTCAWDNTGSQDPQPPVVNCWDVFSFNNTTCAWENTGSQDPQPPIVNCWDVFAFNNTTCAWENTGSQDPQPPIVNCWDVFSFNNTTCAWDNTGTQDPQPPVVNCWDVFSFNNTTCAWENTGTQDPQPPIVNCWDAFTFNNTTCAWENTGSQDPQPPIVNCWDVFSFNNTTCAWDNTGSQDPQPPVVNCWDVFSFNNTTCSWENTGSQDPQPPVVNCWDAFIFNNTTCSWENTGSQDPQPPVVNCWDAFIFNNTTCSWENTGSQDPQPPVVNCWDAFIFNNTTCSWENTGSQDPQPPIVNCWDAFSFNNTTCAWDNTGSQDPQPPVVNCWDVFAFNNTTCAWDNTGTQDPQPPIVNCWDVFSFNNTTCAWDNTGSQDPQPPVVNCWDAFAFNNTTCAWENTGTQDPQPTIVNCWDVFAFNNTTCAWDNTGAQDPQPTIVNCWDMFAFNNTTCAWDNTGAQDPQPTIVNCWDVFAFNNTTCAWENTGAQDAQPPIVNCWDVFAFNNTTCAWENTGSQDPQPPIVNCWDAFIFNNTTCAWDNTGSQDPQPPVVNCWDAFIFNNTTCSWENTGSQDPQPPILNCWDAFIFNNTTCAWENTGSQDPQPPIVNCWDMFSFNNTTCAWENTGTQDPQPPIINCWDVFAFNNTTCAWENTGSQDPQPPVVNCWDVFAFNNTTCAWDNTGTQDPQPPIVNCWDVFAFNNTTCAWDNTGSQDPQPPIVNCWDAFTFNNTTCAWENTGSQDPQPPVVNCWDVFAFNNTTCAWENTGSQDPQPPVVNCWDAFAFNNTTCAWDNTGSQDPQPPIVNCWDAFSFNNTTCAWDNTGSQDPQPSVVNCWDAFIFNNTTCAWDNTGSQDPQPPVLNCWDAFIFNNTTCAWENTGSQDPQPPVVNCWDVFAFNNTTCAWDNTGTQDPQPPIVNCWDVFAFNNTTCAWDNTGSQDPQPPIVNCWDVFAFNNTTCAWEKTGSQDPQPPIVNCWDAFIFNNTTCSWENTGSQDPQPPVVNCWDVFAFNNTTCAWENTGSQDPQPPVVNCWDAFAFNNTTCAWENTGSQDPQPPVVNCWDAFAFNNTTCAWDNTGSQDPQPPIVNCWDAFSFNNTTCAWDNTGSQDPQPSVVNCWDAFIFNNTTCAWDNTGSQDPQPPIVNCWDAFSFNNTSCAWENTGAQDPQPPIVNCWDAFIFNNTTCSWENTGSQDPQPPVVNCWDVFSFNNTTCAWENTGSQDPQPPIVNCWDAFIFNNTTCSWENTGSQDPQPPVVNCWDAFIFNNTTCSWENTGSQDPQPPVVNCWDAFIFNNTTCSWENTGSQDPQPPVVNCWDAFIFNNTTCSWENTGSQDPQPPIVNCWDAFSFNNTTCAWDNTGSQDPQPSIVNCWDVFAFNNTTCAWENTGSQDPQPSIVNCWDVFAFNNTTCAWENTGSQDPQPPIVNCWDAFSFNNTTCAWDNTGSQDPQPPIVNCWDVFAFNNTTCAWDNTGVPPTAILSINPMIACIGDVITISFIGTPGATVIYNDDSSDQSIVLDNVGSASFMITVGSADIIYTLISATIGNCTGTLTQFEVVTVNPNVTPSFTQLGPYCLNDAPDLLPTSSTQGITGTWDGPINTSVAGDIAYNFTPNDPTQCAVSTTMNISILDALTPSFTQLGPYCLNDVPDLLSTSSIEGITGSWDGPINTTVAGDITYNFTPTDPTQCAVATTMLISTLDVTTPSFSQLGPYCLNDMPDVLSTSSIEGITGTWDGPINTSVAGDITYNFTPNDPTQCAVAATILISTLDATTPSFTQLGPYCLNDTPDILPISSIEGITGTWDGPINTSVAGDITYNFTPDDPTQCAVAATMLISTLDATTPSFTQLGPYCLNDTPDILPISSIEGITGTWDGPINTTVEGNFTFNFTPNDPTQCAVATTMQIAINTCGCPTIAPPIGANQEICSDESIPDLNVFNDPLYEVDWYDAITGGNLLLSNSEIFTPSDGGTFYVLYRDIDGCESDRTPISLTINFLPILSEVSRECSIDLLTYSVIVMTDGVLLNSTGIQTDNGDGTFTISNISSGTDVMLTSTSSTTGCDTMMIVPAEDCSCPIIPQPTTTGNVDICRGDPIPTLMGNVEPGLQLNWYDVPTGGIPLATGTDSYVPSTAGTYFLEAVDLNNNCISERTPLIFTISDLPRYDEVDKPCNPAGTFYSVTFRTDGNIFIIPVGDLTDNGDGTFTINNIPDGTNFTITITDANNCSNDVNIIAPNCGCPVIPPPVGMDQTLCQGDAILPLNVSVTPGLQANWYDDPTVGSLLASATSYTPVSAGIYYVEATDGTCISTRIPVELTINPRPSLALVGTVCSPDLLSYDVIVTSDASTLMSTEGTVVDNGNGTFNINGIPQGTNVSLEAIFDLTNCLEPLNIISPDCPCPLINPPSGLNVSYCEGENLEDLVVTADPGLVVDWYDSPGGIVPVEVSSFNYRPDFAGTFYAEARDLINNCVSSRFLIELVENPSPTIQVESIDCDENLTTYTVIISTNVNQIIPTRGRARNLGNGMFSIIDIPVGTDIFIFAINTVTGCSSEPLDIISPVCDCEAIISPIGNDENYCFGDNVSTLNVTVDPDLNVNWYDAVTNGNLLLSGSTSYTPTSPGTFYAEAVNIVNGCVSSRTAIRVVENPEIVYDIIDTTCNTLTGFYAIVINHSADDVMSNIGSVVNNLGQAEISDIPNGTDAIFTITNRITGCDTIITLIAPDCNCPSTATPIGLDTSFCSGSVLPEISVVVDPGLAVNWYDELTNGNLLLSNSLSYTPTTSGTYYAEAEDQDGCTSDRLPIVVSEVALPSYAIIRSDCNPTRTEYTLVISTDANTLSSDIGIVTNNNDGTFTISNVPISNPVNIDLEILPLGCTANDIIPPPDCNCPSVNSPIGSDVTICSDENIPVLSVTVDVNHIANWYDAPINGNLLQANSLNYLPTVAGIYYVEAENQISDCTSSRTPITLIINDIPNLTSTNTSCDAGSAFYQVDLESNATAVFSTDGVVINLGSNLYTISNIPDGSDINVTLSFTDTNCDTIFQVSAPDCNCPVINPPVGRDAFICQGESLLPLSVLIDSNLRARWFDSPVGGVEIASDVLTYLPFVAGTYYIEAYDPISNCVSTRISISLSVLPKPSLEVIDIACIDGTNNYQIVLISDADNIMSTQGNVIQQPNNTFLINQISSSFDAIILATFNGSRCDSSLVVLAPNCCPLEFPEIIIDSPDDLHCMQSEVMIDGSASELGSTISLQWYDNDFVAIAGATSPQLVVDQSGTYYLESTDGPSGCINIDTIDVIEQAIQSYDLVPQVANCNDDNSASFMIANVLGNSGPYTYSLNDGPFLETNTFENLSAGEYFVSIMDNNGCNVFDSLTIPETPELLVDLGSEITIQLGDSVQLQTITSTPALQYAWNSNPNLSCLDCRDPWVSPTQTMRYFVTVTDINGCVESTSVLVIVENNIDLYIPNAFTPNGDGINDQFTIFGNDRVLNIRTFIIYNRWGDQVFRASDLPPNREDLGWNGIFRDQPSPIGVYVYYAEIEVFGGGIEKIDGDVTLLK